MAHAVNLQVYATGLSAAVGLLNAKESLAGVALIAPVCQRLHVLESQGQFAVLLCAVLIRLEHELAKKRTRVGAAEHQRGAQNEEKTCGIIHNRQEESLVKKLLTQHLFSCCILPLATPLWPGQRVSRKCVQLDTQDLQIKKHYKAFPDQCNL